MAKRRANGKGTLRQRGDGRWEGRVVVGYDDKGLPIGIVYNGTTYTYRKNVQGDIIAILNSAGTEVVNYTYNAWGVATVGGTMASTLGAKNPFRYRGYYYDTETGFYYLNSRYYDPTTGRFLNPEPNIDIGGFDSDAGLLGYNVYAYCKNNPVNFADFTGEFTVSVFTLNNNQLNKLEAKLESKIASIDTARSIGDFVIGLASAIPKFSISVLLVIVITSSFNLYAKGSHSN